MGTLLTSVVIDGLAFCIALLVVPGLSVPDDPLHVLIAAVLFAIVSAAVRPVLWMLSCPLIFITLAPMIVLLHALTLWFSSWLAGMLGASTTVGGLLPAMLGAVVISAVRMAAMNALRYYGRRQTVFQNQADLQHLQRTKEWLERECDHWKRLIEEGDRRIREHSAPIIPSGEDCRRPTQRLLEPQYGVSPQSQGTPDMRRRRLKMSNDGPGGSR